MNLYEETFKKLNLWLTQVIFDLLFRSETFPSSIVLICFYILFFLQRQSFTKSYINPSRSFPGGQMPSYVSRAALFPCMMLYATQMNLLCGCKCVYWGNKFKKDLPGKELQRQAHMRASEREQVCKEVPTK